MAEQGLARQMMAQRLMTDLRDDPFSGSRFFNAGSTPSDFMSPDDAMMAGPQGVESDPSVFSRIGSALVGDTDVDSGYILPIGTTPEGDLVPAFPKLVQGAAAGVRDAARTAGRALSGDPRYIPVNGQLPPAVIDEINNFGLSVMGGGMTGANLLRGSIPEGSIGIFAGKSAKTFPVANKAQEAIDQIVANQSRLMNEYQYVTNELTKGRMVLGDELTDQFNARRAALMDQMDTNSLELGRLQDESVQRIDEIFADAPAGDALADRPGRGAFFQTEREFGKGIFKLPDNQYRFEIDDSNATVQIPGFADDVKISDLAAGPDGDQVLTVNEDFAKSILSVPGFQPKLLKIGDLFDHPELYEAYPQLRDYRVVFFDDPKRSALGFFKEDQKQIGVNIASLIRSGRGEAATAGEFKDKVADILVHELQHAVQGIEGFARGANVQLAPAIREKAIKEHEAVFARTAPAADRYNQLSAELSDYSTASAIKRYENMSMRDSFQPRMLFNSADFYKYGDRIRRELSDELGYTYNKRKSVQRERWIAAAFAKMAEYTKEESAAATALAENLTAKDIDRRIRQIGRGMDKTRGDLLDFRNAGRALEGLTQDVGLPPNTTFRLGSGNYQVYLNSLGEVEARMVQARRGTTYKDNFMGIGQPEQFDRSIFPPDQTYEGQMSSPPPMGLRNTFVYDIDDLRDMI